jgi:hypothetical protein
MPDALVLTGLMWCRAPGDADRFAAALDRAGVAALGAGEAIGEVPAEVIRACARHGIPLIAVPAETSVAAVTEEVSRQLGGDRATAMTRVLGRRRLLLSAVAEGAGLDAMFRLMGRELGAECWLLTGLGRVVGGTSPSLPGPLALTLACEYLKAEMLPAAVAVTGPEAAGGWYSLFGVGGEGAAPAEIASLMRAAGLRRDGRYVVIALAAEADRMTGPNAGRWRGDLAAELVLPLAAGAVAAPLGEEIILLVPAPEGTGPEDTGLEGAAPEDTVPEDAGPENPAHLLAARIRDADPVVAADRSRIRVTAGVSALTAGVTALGGALQEASSARRLAALRGPAAVAVVTSDEVASHELLLATVPAGVLRPFRERLLGPLLAYDDRHRAELLPTLREFLACSGSWNTCAAAMHVHVNTVRYRIRRIEELTGRDLSRLADQVDFFLALQIR